MIKASFTFICAFDKIQKIFTVYMYSSTTKGTGLCSTVDYKSYSMCWKKKLKEQTVAEVFERLYAQQA
jgi:hypothetical protein